MDKKNKKETIELVSKLAREFTQNTKKAHESFTKEEVTHVSFVSGMQVGVMHAQQCISIMVETLRETSEEMPDSKDFMDSIEKILIEINAQIETLRLPVENYISYSGLEKDKNLN